MIALLFGFAAHGQGIDVCVDIATNFVDTGTTDYFYGNGPNAARYLRVSAKYYQQSSGQWVSVDGYAGNTGCYDTGAVQGDTGLKITAYSEILRSGVTVKAFPVAPTGFNNESVATVSWYVPNPTSATLNYTIPASQVWNHAMLASFSWHRTGAMHLNQHSSRDCCLSGEDDDGTCLTPGSDSYTDFGTPMEIRMYAGGNVCGGSTYECDVNGNGTFEADEAQGCPGVWFTCAQRMAIMHEQGHVVVEQRIGRRSLANHHDLFDPIDAIDQRACIGQHVPDTPEVFSGWNKKGELKEDLQSTAAREGWASFYSAWIFNKYWQPNCGYANDITLYDYDLDGTDSINSAGVAVVSVVDMDNDYSTHPGHYDCHNHGVGDLGEPDLANPTEIWTAQDDWLEAASTTGPCRLENNSIDDRGTAYDWASFFWRLSNTSQVQGMPQGQSVSLGQLSDLYVDMCPTSWHNRDSPPVHAAKRVMNRLHASAVEHGLSSEVTDENHRGQDH